MRSTAHTANWEEKERSVRRAIKYGRMNSPARPSNASPVNPIKVGDNTSIIVAFGRTGFRKIFQRTARMKYAM